MGEVVARPSGAMKVTRNAGGIDLRLDKTRGAWQIHKRLSHSSNKINLFRTSLDHLLLGKAADVHIIELFFRMDYLDFRYMDF